VVEDSGFSFHSPTTAILSNQIHLSSTLELTHILSSPFRHGPLTPLIDIILSAIYKDMPGYLSINTSHGDVIATIKQSIAERRPLALCRFGDGEFCFINHHSTPSRWSGVHGWEWVHHRQNLNHCPHHAETTRNSCQRNPTHSRPKSDSRGEG